MTSRKPLVIVPVVLALVLAGLFLPVRVSIEPYGVLSLESKITISIGYEAAYASPGITVDSPTTTYGADSDSHTFSHTSTGGPTGLIVVSVSGVSGDKQVSSVTYAGQALTEAISRQYGGTSGPYVSMWYLKAPATGANNVVVTCTATDKFAIGVVSFTGVDQTTPVDGAVYAEIKAGNALSVDVASAVGDLVLDASAYTNSGAPTVDPSQTQQWVGEMGGGGASGMFGAGSTEAGAATVTMSWTAAQGGKERVICALNINAAPEPDISNLPTSKDFGTVSESTDYWSKGSAPVWPLDDTECYFTVTNNSSSAVNIGISATNFSGGTPGWTLAGTPAGDTVTLKAGKSGDNAEGDMFVLTISDQTNFISGLAASASKKWELKMETPTSFSNGDPKTATVTLTATFP